VNLTGGDGAGGGAPAVPGTSFADATSPELAYLVTGEAAIDNPIPLTSGTQPGSLWQLPVSSTGGSQAQWEVVQTLPNTNENYDFGVYITFKNTIGSTQGISASLSYAPTPTVPFSAVAAGQASNSLTIPRFAVGAASSGTPFLNINLCTTALLFPYVTTAPGYDTGIAISNTTSDPFGTTNQAGLCTLYWYGGAPGATTASTFPTPTTLGAGGVGNTVPIMTGTTALTISSQSVGPNFNGYMIALCNFQFAHGYASITDIGVRNIMSSYLALVITNPTTTLASRGAYPGQFTGVESLSQ